MTEIKIEKKQKIWPWIVGIGIIAILIYFTVINQKKTETDQVTVKLLGITENNATVAAYISFVNNDTIKMTLDHKFTHEALLELVDATKAMAGEINFKVSDELDKVKEYARLITVDPFETTHDDDIRLAADIVTNELRNMQQAKYPELTDDVTQLENATASIDPDILTLKQQVAVITFFRKAADLLRKMN